MATEGVVSRTSVGNGERSRRVALENSDRTTHGLGRMREKSVVITGAAKGIGRATAELFAREGARLVVTDVDEAGLGELSERLASSGAEVETVVGDVSVAEDAKKMIAAAVERFGRIEVLIANAGVIPLNNIVEATPEDWEYVMAVDGRGMFLCCKYAVEAMLEFGGGSIVFRRRSGRSTTLPASPSAPVLRISRVPALLRARWVP